LQRLRHRDLGEENLRELFSVTRRHCSELSDVLVTPTKLLQDALEWKSALMRRILCSKRPSKAE
jgi:hypothetical protein